MLAMMLQVGKRYWIKGPRFNAVYLVLHVEPDFTPGEYYVVAKRSPRPTRGCRDGFGDQLYRLLEDHTITPVARGTRA